MPNHDLVATIQKEKQKLATEIAEFALQLSYQEKMAVCLAAGIHEDTFDRYKTVVAKIPRATKIINACKKVIADREVAA